MSYPKAALQFSNKVIRKMGGKVQTTLAKGQRGRCSLCPIAQTIKNGLDANGVEYHKIFVEPEVVYIHGYRSDWNTENIFDASEGAAAFINRFDNGKYEEFKRESV